MSDRTPLQCHVYDCPQEQREAVLRVLVDSYGLDLDWGSADPSAGLCLTQPYTGHDLRVGSAAELAAALREAAPGSSFVLWEDPAYEWLGSLEAQAPCLGAFSADCDAGGTVLCTLPQASQIIRAAAGRELVINGRPAGHWVAQETLLAEFDKAMGGPWLRDRREQTPIGDAAALDHIAEMMRGPQRGASMLEDIGSLVTKTGRSIENYPRQPAHVGPALTMPGSHRNGRRRT